MLSKIPNKQFFKIGEVGKITGVKPHVLRYWESEFRSIRPQKSRTNQRLYRRIDVERVLLIKQLLYHEGYTIAGAKKRIKEVFQSKHRQIKQSDSPSLDSLKKIQAQILDLLRILEED